MAFSGEEGEQCCLLALLRMPSGSAGPCLAFRASVDLPRHSPGRQGPGDIHLYRWDGSSVCLACVQVPQSSCSRVEDVVALAWCWAAVSLFLHAKPHLCLLAVDFGDSMGRGNPAGLPEQNVFACMGSRCLLWTSGREPADI